MPADAGTSSLGSFHVAVGETAHAPDRTPRHPRKTHGAVLTCVLYMGFVDGLSQRQIGKRIGVSQMQISRIHHRALDKLLTALRGESREAEAA